MVRVGDVTRIIERQYPLRFAAPDDNCGLQLGDPDGPVTRVVVALDADREAVRRAGDLGAELLVTHHPLLYAPLRRIDTTGPVGSVAAAALRGGLSVCAAHTNLDASPGGLAAEAARRAGLRQIETMGGGSRGGRFKLVVFVPAAAVDAVHGAMSEAGAGVIGRYDHCAFLAGGQGLYRPGRGSSPMQGKAGRLERAGEVRLETPVAEEVLAGVVRAMRAAHPYEEVAWDLYPLQAPAEGGYGCVGGRETKVSFHALAREVAAAFKTQARLSGRVDGAVGRLAVVPGSGGGLLEEAHRRGAQVLVTGEVRYHQMTEAEHYGMGIIELGHDRSEMPAVDLLARTLRNEGTLKAAKIRIHTYRRPRAAGVPRWN